MKTKSTPFIAAFALICSIALLGVSAPATAQNEMAGNTFYVQDPMGRNAISFKSLAPLEDIIGITHLISGHIMFDPAHPDKGVHAQFTVPVKSLDTGIPLRNQHLQSADWLNAEAYPDVGLVIDTIKKIETVKSSDASITYDATVSGTFSLKGKEAIVEFPARVTWLKETEMTQKRLPGNLLAIRAEFEITLSDFDVTGPQGMGIIGAKVGETITIDVNIMGNTTAPAGK